MNRKHARLVLLVSALRHETDGQLDLRAYAAEVAKSKIDTELARKLWHAADLPNPPTTVDDVMRDVVDPHLGAYP